MNWLYFISSALAYGFENNLAFLDSTHSLCGGVDIREITISIAHQLFANRTLTSLQLTNCYLDRIRLMNPKLNAIIEVNPDARRIADRLDKRFDRTFKFKGPLHGIPILIKDNIATGDKMNTTAGSWALLGAKPKRNAKVVRKLRNAGAIILGKTNLSEFSGVLSPELEQGFSGRGGQTIYPYKLKARPYGSSSGSAVAIAANLALVSLGTDTEGSIINPSASTALVGSKPSVGLISMQGVIPVAPTQESVGVLARTLQDNLLVTALLFDSISFFGMVDCCNFVPLSVKDLHIGLIKFPFVNDSELDLQISVLEQKLQKLAQDGLRITSFTLDDEPSFDKVTYVYLTEFKHYLNKYLEDQTLPNQPIKSLEDVIEFNANNKNLYPSGLKQNWFLLSQNTTGIDDPQYIRTQAMIQKLASGLINELMGNYHFNAIVTLSHPTLASNVPPSVAGYPIITILLGIMKDGSPFGASIYSKWGHEYEIYSFAHALDPETSAREPPLFLD